MLYKPSILSVLAGFFIIGCLVYTAYNYNQLSANEGWGVVGMIGLIGFGILLLIIDFIIQRIFTSKRTVNIVGAIIALISAVFIFSGT